MRALLARNQDDSKIARGLPTGTAVANKSGWYTGVANDVAIVYGPKATYVLAVLSEGVASDEAGNQLIAGVSRLVYELWNR
jgi:beta-lactamase class A